MAVDEGAALGHGAEEADGDGWEDAQTFFYAGVHVGEIGENVHVDVRFCLAGGSQLILEALELGGVAKEEVEETAQFGGCSLAAGDAGANVSALSSSGEWRRIVWLT